MAIGFPGKGSAFNETPVFAWCGGSAPSKNWGFTGFYLPGVLTKSRQFSLKRRLRQRFRENWR
jgi:hypothetical protein